MKSLTDEIKLTIELMQGDIDDGAHGELQSHLCSLLEMKRELLGELVYTGMPDQIQVWPADADERIDVVGQNDNDGELYWHTNRGVSPDIDPATRVIVEYRNGNHADGCRKDFWWALGESGYSIIRWRLA